MTLLATLHMTRVHLHPVSDPTAGVIAGSAGSIGGGGTRSDNFELSGAFRTYANGVTRLVTGTATTRVQNFTLRALPSADVTKVLNMVGKTCLFRDTYGRALYGSFLVTSMTDIPLSGEADGTPSPLLTDIAITFQSVNYTEEV